MKSNGLVVVGLQYGDEGKGKIIDSILKPGDACVRYQGGPNAGHTIIKNGKKYVLHSLPTGVLTPGVANFIGAGCVVDPESLHKEITDLHLEEDPLLYISNSAHTITKDMLTTEKESSVASKVGTTNRGIGPAYEARAARTGMRLSNDILERFDLLQTKRLNHLWPELEKFERVVYEGAQGTMLDVSYGTYPYVTSSNTIAANACVGAGVPPTSIYGILGVLKPYTTRVGNGPFPTEDDGHFGNDLRTLGSEFGSTTGRARRCGSLNVDEVKFAVEVNGCNQLALTKLDILSAFDKIPVSVNGKTVYFDGWKSDISSIRKSNDLPTRCRDFIIELESMIGMSFSLIGVGPDSSQLIRIGGW